MTRGTAVQLVFQQAGLTITAYASPLQDGSAGDRHPRAQHRQRRRHHGRRAAGRNRARGRAMMLCRLLAAFALPRAFAARAGEASVRIKDIASLQGVRDNQIVGYGLVIGLKGTGDSLRNSPFTEQSLQSMLDSMGINVRDSSLRTRNVAGVIVTAELPPFVGKGARIDVTVSSLGDATSLLGGTLVMTSMMGADGEIYAVAQGPVAVSGFSSEGDAESLTEGVPTTGRIPNGALVEREVQGDFDELDGLVLELKNPDFITAIRVVDAINAYAAGRYGGEVAFERDFRTIELAKPDECRAPALHRRDHRAHGRARLAGARRHRRAHRNGGHRPQRADLDGRRDARQSHGAGHRNAGRFAAGAILATARRPRCRAPSSTPRRPAASSRSWAARTCRRWSSGLNQIGLKPTGIIAILQAIKSAGALQAELIIQ